jgi:2-polyprenyl-3-methyl-5-hydroxy-6-metoxy-1,4-benzoquinol methylase
VHDKVCCDFGCGPAVAGRTLANNGAKRVYCLDVSEGFLRVAQDKAEKEGLVGKMEFINIGDR